MKEFSFSFKDVMTKIIKALDFIAFGLWNTTSFGYRRVYGLVSLTAVLWGLQYISAYVWGNLNGVADPVIGLPALPWGFSVFYTGPMWHFMGPKVDFLQWFIAAFIALGFLAVSRYTYPPKGLSSGRLGRVQFFTYHASLTFVVLWCFVQFEFPPIFFGLFG